MWSLNLKWVSVCHGGVLSLCFCGLGELLKVMNRFYKKKEMQKLAADHGLDGEKENSRSCQHSNNCIYLTMSSLNTHSSSKVYYKVQSLRGETCSPFILCLCAARLFHQAFISFRKYTLEMASLPADLHIILSDICCGAGWSVSVHMDYAH